MANLSTGDPLKIPSAFTRPVTVRTLHREWYSHPIYEPSEKEPDMTKKAGQLLDVLLAVLVVNKIFAMSCSPEKKAAEGQAKHDTPTEVAPASIKVTP